ncbi:hypothetical protein J421_0963 [Gemmatirosa kalamazoonensis]|uniref:Uncharacterized protein n=1 Tax=Gemmatirosa kalamazoonensis TaxID=861299 RepID=W0RDU5_9BACT|nr:hypothetical protein [Gemmatirosa kalamazoonensis]AHG88500.1 hypothetical protein J421_0963 [Gemmatirosa kalamazoonensis]
MSDSMPDAPLQPTDPPTPEALHAALERLAAHLAAARQPNTELMRSALTGYVRAAVGAGLTLADTRQVAGALVRSVGLAQGWDTERTDAVRSALARLVRASYVVEARRPRSEVA